MIKLPTSKGANSPTALKKTTKFRNKTDGTHPWYQKNRWRGNPNNPLGKRGGLRERQLMKQPLCEYCLEIGKTKQATVVDHIIEWKSGKTEEERWQLFTDPENHRSLCVSCHNSKTSKNNK